MSRSSWDCAHLKSDKCDIFKKECIPGEKGCVLYSKARFSGESPSNEAFEKKMQRKMHELLKK